MVVLFYKTKTMENIKLKDKIFKPYMCKEEIEQIINDLAVKLKEEYKDKDPLFIAILNGSFIFAADLMKQLDFPCRISFIKVCSYEGICTSNNIKQLIGLKENLENENIVILEDIIDTGITIEGIINTINMQKPASVKVCTFLFKPESFIKSYKIDFIGKSIPNDFVVGYGLDYDGYGRNIPSIYQIKL